MLLFITGACKVKAAATQAIRVLHRQPKSLRVVVPTYHTNLSSSLHAAQEACDTYPTGCYHPLHLPTTKSSPVNMLSSAS
jgi:hypothetical protein